MHETASLLGDAEFELNAEVETVTYRNEENDWSILKVRLPDRREVHTVLGFTNARAGQQVSMLGKWERDRVHGRQFHASRMTAINPVSREGMVRYLSSGVLPGVGEKMAAQLVAHFGDKTLEALDGPAEVLFMPGLRHKKAARIVKAWSEQKQVSEIMLFLHSQNVSASLCRRIYRQYGQESMACIRRNPYCLATEVRGIGFKTADGLALEMGIPKNSHQRILAGLVFLMREASGQGHCGVIRSELVSTTVEYLSVHESEANASLDHELQREDDDSGQGRLFEQHGYAVASDEGVTPQEVPAIFLTALARCEEVIAQTLCRMMGKQPVWAGNFTLDAAITWGEKHCSMQLAPEQRAAVVMGLTQRVSVLTGGPGCGKTATLNVLLAILQRAQVRVALAAPTGKAAQTASEATGIAGSTIHRLFGLRGSSGADIGNEIEADILVLDEMSMQDVPLMYQVCKAMPEHCALLLVGDFNQLSSVGPGQVLRDIIASGVVPVTRLTQVFRQAQGSLIITNAHRINAGQMPRHGNADEDFFIIDETRSPSIAKALINADASAIPAAVAEACAAEIVSLVKDRVPAKYGFDSVEDIQVLAPMTKGICGVHALNVRLQEALNPDGPNPRNPNGVSMLKFGIRFAVGDRVIQCRNNYTLDIYNGDSGRVLQILTEEEEIVVEFGGSVVAIPFDELDDLLLDYSRTIHKSQGSQVPVVIIPMVTQHWMMLQRNLLYTGVTRAKKLVILVGVRRAIEQAVRTVSSTKRVTRLAGLLRLTLTEIFAS